jgi:hypothetical protein
MPARASCCKYLIQIAVPDALSGALQAGAWQSGARQSEAWQAGAWQAGAWQAGAWQAGAWQAGAWQLERGGSDSRGRGIVDPNQWRD